MASYDLSISSVVDVSDLTTSALTENISSVVSASNTVSYNNSITVHEVVDIDTILHADMTTSLSSVVAARDATTSAYFRSVVDNLDATDSVSHNSLTSFSDTVQCFGTAAHSSVMANSIAEVVTVSDAFTPGQSWSVIETVDIGDTFSSTMAAELSISSVATAEEATTSQVNQHQSVTSTFEADGTVSFGSSVYNLSVSDTVLALDKIWAKDLTAIAWVLNTQSGGITTYDNYAFTSLAFHGGKLYGTSAEGIFEFGADKDDGRDISAFIKGGFDDFGNHMKKRVSDIYVGYTGGDLECDVETFDKQVYTYDMEHREEEAPHNSRIKPGRGLSSRYWRFGFRNIDGADFQLQDVTVYTAASVNRRL
jgi:hypothetical protein